MASIFILELGNELVSRDRAIGGAQLSRLDNLGSRVVVMLAHFVGKIINFQSGGVSVSWYNDAASVGVSDRVVYSAVSRVPE